jgi:endonuclease/exonuclease/phosphatase family metal-dependent hydrolase
MPLRAFRCTALILAAVAAALAFAAPAGAADQPRLKVMSRNVYLGADLTPGTKATSVQELVNAAGVILNQVDANKPSVRMKNLANEILSKQPDLVGLQEAALWRTEPCDQNPVPPKATTVRYDYVKLLLKVLNKGQKRYKVVVSKPEFDFEVWANTDGNEATAGTGCPFGSEINGRLTMRDAILARIGHVTTTNPKSKTFDTLLQVRPGGVPVDVTRGWTAIDATVKGSRTVRFVNTHLEAFDNQATNHTNKGTDVGNGEIREAQAKELFAKGGPATGKRVILLGDLNSDKKTEVKPGDGLAYKALLGAGFAERSATKPLGCCLHADVLTTGGGGNISDFNHKVDHVMTNAPKTIKLVTSSVTGRQPANGYWGSDHAGLFSVLAIP